jgi:hypothetical protein
MGSKPLTHYIMNTILDQIPTAADEFRGWARECKVYRNQAWRNGVVTHRLGSKSKPEYVTYQMPNGRIFRVPVDMIAEQHMNTMKVSNKDTITN